MQRYFVLYMMHQACKNVLMFIMFFLVFVMKSTAIFYICIVFVCACACDEHIFLHHASEKHIFYIMYYYAFYAGYFKKTNLKN